jgi:Trypsin
MRLARIVGIASVVMMIAACRDVAPTGLHATASAPTFIVNGTPTGSAYANVGALLFDFDRNGKLDGNDEWCTGSLVAPDVFLTASHCIVTPFTPPGSQFYVSFAPDLFANGIKVIAATRVVHDPLFGHDEAKLHDLALVFLPSGSTKGMTPLKLPAAGILDQLSAKGKLSKTMFVNVGYGVSANRTGVPTFSFDGVRKSSLSEFRGLTQTWLGLLMNTAATGQGGDCFGDSGGPKFIEGDATTIYATVTTGDANCRATSWDWRLDSPEARGFLGQYLTLP